MKYAVLSDIHSNLEALRACLAHARARGAEQYAFLGDLVGYGADPVACIDIVGTLAAQGAVVVRGNHDESVLSGLCENLNFVARDAIYWTRSQLGQTERDFLQSLPMVVRKEDSAYVHASADKPGSWTYVENEKLAGLSMTGAKTTFTFSGHVHSQNLYYRMNQAIPRTFQPMPGVPIPILPHRQWLAIVGSVGQPRDGNNAASYALIDRDQNTLTFFRVPYDYMSAAKKILAAGLPQRLALRLESGR